jgi:hypothetical protein
MEKQSDGMEEVLKGYDERTPLSADTLSPEAAKEQTDLLIAAHDREKQQPYFVDYLDPEISLEDLRRRTKN